MPSKTDFEALLREEIATKKRQKDKGKQCLKYLEDIMQPTIVSNLKESVAKMGDPNKESPDHSSAQASLIALMRVMSLVEKSIDYSEQEEALEIMNNNS